MISGPSRDPNGARLRRVDKEISGVHPLLLSQVDTQFVR